MKYRLLTILAASLAIPAAANAATYELIATDTSVETQLCIQSATGPVIRLKNNLRKERVPRHKIDRVLRCNDMEVSRFVAAYGSERMKRLFRRPQHQC